MRKLISFVHISLDGFVAGPNGEMDWIKINDEMFAFVEDRIRNCDSAIYGRVTYQMMEGYWPTAADRPGASRHDIEHSRWYGGIRKIVLSRTLKEKDLSNTVIISSNLVEDVKAIKEEQGNEILIFGSPSATHALQAEHLVDGYWLFLNPVILGEGIPLFRDIKKKTGLKLDDYRQFDSGVMALAYSVEK